MKNGTNEHPWINFKLDLEGVSPNTLMLLGEAQSKCKHIAGALLDPATAEEFHSLYLAKGALATTAIEGNTLTESQVKAHIGGSLVLPSSKEYLRQEVENILIVCNEIADSHFQGVPVDLSTDEIKEYNELVLKNLTVNAGVIPGQLRKINVTVGNYLAPPAPKVKIFLDKLCNMLEGDSFSKLGERWEIATGILKAVIAHLYIAWIHPFGDGNGRTARLVEFKLCISAGVPGPAAHLLSNHYNETRSNYYQALERSSRQENPFEFIDYALAGYVDQLGEQIKKIRQTQYKSFWVNYVHTYFKGKDGVADKRRKNLLLDLSENAFPTNEWLNISKIEDVSARVMKEYISLATKTKLRDIKELVNSKLLERDGAKVRPYVDIISAYLPRQVR